MATLADELLADLMEDGSDLDQDEPGFSGDEGAGIKDSTMDDANEETTTIDESEVAAAIDAENEDEAKALVEKINFSSVSDVRSVASLMKALKPILEVSSQFPPPNLPPILVVYNYIDIVLTCFLFE